MDSLSNSELQAENDNDLPDDEFDRLLDEFIQSQLSEEETEDEEESDNSPSNTSLHIIFKILFSPYATQKNKYPEIHYAHNSVLMKENIYSFRQNA